MYLASQEQRHKENLDRFKALDFKLWGVFLLLLASYVTSIAMQLAHV